MQSSEFDFLEPVEESKIDIPKIIHKIKVNWLYSVLCAIVLIGFAALYLYITNPIYNAVATVLIKDNTGQSGSQQNSGLASLQNLGLIPGTSNVDNEREIITSYPLVYQVVKDLQLFLSFSTRKNLKSIPLYKNALPFIVNIDSFKTENLTEEQLNYEITINNKGFTINSDGQTWNCKWGQSLILPIGKLSFVEDSLLKQWSTSEVITMSVSNIASVADAYQNQIDAAVSNKQTSIINLSMPTSIPKQGVDVMNRLIEVYQLSNIDDNNRVTDSTIQFIDSRLMVVGAELDSIEANIQNFKEKNDLADLTEQSKALIENAGVYSQNLSAQEVQLSITNSLIEYMKKNEDNTRIVPASLTINDPSVASTIDNYNKLLLQKERLLLSATRENPVVMNLEEQLIGLRKDMVTNLHSIKLSLEAGLSKMEQNSGSINERIRQVPAKERTFVEYTRQQSIKQELFLYLLQKREESLIAKSSTVSNARVIMPGRIETKPLAPNKKIILALSFCIGVVLPFIISLFRNLANVKIKTKEDIDNGTSAPILAEIIHNEEKSNSIISVSATSRDPLAEQFRILRTDLNFLLPNSSDKVILFTSSMPNEGKSFVSMNLSAMMAFSGKKVIILEFDLRKPKLSRGLIKNIEKGYSQYAIGQASIDEIIYSIEGHPNLSIMPSGPLPPNPAELILLERTKVLFNNLRERFDYIIIDTTPCIVADARLLSRYADITLYLLRVDLTYKEQLKQIEKLYKENKLPRLNLIVNDVDTSKKQGYYYGYGKYGYYGYGYGYGYFGEQEKKLKRSWLKFGNKHFKK